MVGGALGGVNLPTTYKFCRHSCVLVNFTTELIAMKVVSLLKTEPEEVVGDRQGWGGGGLVPST